MRVIAGRLRGASLRVPRGTAVRPTYDRVRESVFSILEPHLNDAVVLDLFAGSGCLGIESLSRGAASATFVEIDRAVLAVVAENVDRLGLSKESRLLRGDGLEAIEGALSGDVFDLIFVDPPYSSGLAERSLELLGASGLLAGSAVVVVEHGTEEELPEAAGGLSRFRRKRYGGTTVDFYEARETDAGGGDQT
jgi:16S rRNA (guanine(966)-N(2))-methyltransferase RsmD